MVLYRVESFKIPKKYGFQPNGYFTNQCNENYTLRTREKYTNTCQVVKGEIFSL
jgi:hypothetical protein